MSKIIENSPSVTFAETIDNLITPIKKYGIVYFAFTRITKENEFFAFTNNANWSQEYLEGEYYNYDLVSDRSLIKEHEPYFYLLWDTLPITQDLNQLLESKSRNHQLGHNFSISFPSLDHTDTFVFGANINNTGINQVYLNHMDELYFFTQYFLETVSKHAELGEKFLDTRVLIPGKQNYNELIPSLILNKQNQLVSFDSMEALSFTRTKRRYSVMANGKLIELSYKEMLVLLLLKQGIKTQGIADKMFLSHRTIEDYIKRLKLKFHCKTLFQLGVIISATRIQL